MAPKSTPTPAASTASTGPAAGKVASPATPAPLTEVDLTKVNWSDLPQDQLDAIMENAAKQRAERAAAAQLAAQKEQLAKLSAHVVTAKTSIEELEKAIDEGNMAVASKAIAAFSVTSKALLQDAKTGNVKVTAATAARPGEDRDLVFDILGEDPTRVFTVSDMTKEVVERTGKVGKSSGAVQNNLDRATDLGYAEKVSADNETRRYQGTEAARAAYLARHPEAAPAAPEVTPAAEAAKDGDTPPAE